MTKQERETRQRMQWADEARKQIVSAKLALGEARRSYEAAKEQLEDKGEWAEYCRTRKLGRHHDSRHI